MHTQRRGFLAAFAIAALAPLPGRAQAGTVRLRGTIEALSATRLTLRTRGGERVELALVPGLVVTEMVPIQLAQVKAGSFVGVGGIPQADGSQRAIAIVLFPESMRGTGEGHRPFDYLPDSTMTNATVAEVAASPQGGRLELRYRDGRQTIVAPPEAPVVSLRPADRRLLAVGAAVSLSAQEVAGTPTAVRITAGRNGFVPPY